MPRSSPQMRLDFDAPSSPPEPQGPRVLSVRAVTGGLRAMIEEAYEDVWVEGELSNFKRHTSGHCYFTLKDADAQLRGVLWRHQANRLFFAPRDGMLVRVRGQISVYERRGDVQIIGRTMKLAGEGALQKAYEELKRRLKAEGLFAPELKRPLPAFPETVGLVTSGTSAALQDMLSVLRRRFPQVQVLVCPVQVQGLGAAEQIAAAIDTFSAQPDGSPYRPDVLIVGRGGGSMEDLWAFNEEVVARALHACTVPVVSAVGHETDFSIADFVADVRAATPSMAAEVVVPDRREIELAVRGMASSLGEAVLNRVRQHRQQIDALTRSHRFNRPVQRLREQQQRLDELNHRLNRAGRQLVQDRTRSVDTLHQRLRALDPMRPFQRGYACVERDGARIRAAADLAPGDLLRLRFADGARPARVTAEAHEAPAPQRD